MKFNEREKQLLESAIWTAKRLSKENLERIHNTHGKIDLTKMEEELIKEYEKLEKKIK